MSKELNQQEFIKILKQVLGVFNVDQIDPLKAFIMIERIRAIVEENS